MKIKEGDQISEILNKYKKFYGMREILEKIDFL